MPAKKFLEKRFSQDGGYKDSYPDKAFRMCLLGATDEQMAGIFGVSREILSEWKEDHEEFRDAIALGKIEADAEIAHSLYQRAKGFRYDAVKIFLPKDSTTPVYAPYQEYAIPDTNAASLWLRNRQKELWKDRPQDAGGDGAGQLMDEVRDLLAQSNGRLALVMAPQADGPITMKDITPLPAEPGAAPEVIEVEITPPADEPIEK